MSLHKLLVFSFGALLFQSFAFGTIVQKCSKGLEPHFVNITNCEREPCLIPVGTVMSLQVAFTVPKTSNTLTPKVWATIIPGVPIPYPLQDSGCESIVNGYCPIYEDEILLYLFNMPIDNYPTVSFTLEFQLQGDNEEIFTCFKAKCAVVKPYEAIAQKSYNEKFKINELQTLT